MRVLQNVELCAVAGGEVYVGEADWYPLDPVYVSGVTGLCITGAIGAVGAIGSAFRSSSWDNVLKAMAAFSLLVGTGCAYDLLLATGYTQMEVNRFVGLNPYLP